VYRKSQDLISIGAYQAGSNPKIDEAIQMHEPMRDFLRQETTTGHSRQESWQQLTQTLQQSQSAQMAPTASMEQQPGGQFAPQMQEQPQMQPQPQPQFQPGNSPPQMMA